MKPLLPTTVAAVVVLSSCASPVPGPGAGVHDVVVQNGTVYDGSGGAPFAGTVAIGGDRISYIGPPAALRGGR